MKITVGVPSRNRPLDLAAAILALDKTKSFGHQVDYIVGLDTDDLVTIEVAENLKTRLPITMSIADRGIGLGEIHNRMTAAADPDAVFLLWSDRIVPCLEHWDHALAMAAMQFANRVLWMDSIHLVGAGQFALPPQWRKAMPCPPCPGYFPFWFEDTWVEEVDHYVHGMPRIASYAKCAGPRTAKTTRMRELPFWIEFYQFCLPMRLEEAKRIAENLGVIPQDNKELVNHFSNRMADMLARKDVLTEMFGGGGEPDESYLRAKAHAEAIMADRVPGRAFA